MNLPDPATLLPQMAAALTAHLQQRQISQPHFIGIRTGGIWVAEALLQHLGLQMTTGHP